MAINTRMTFPTFCYEGSLKDYPKSIRKFVENLVKQHQRWYQEEYRKRYGVKKEQHG